MTSISVKRETKAEFDELQPEGHTQDEFVEELLAAYRRDNGEIVDVEQMVEEITEQTAARMELAAYRGTQEALENNGT
jgi:N-acyl-D-aspartate/D-glutamate deacylase